MKKFLNNKVFIREKHSAMNLVGKSSAAAHYL